jgi:hypothetical protein
MPIIQDSAAVDVSTVAATQGPTAEVGVIRITQVPGPWIVRVRTQWPTPDAGPGTFVPGLGMPNTYVRVIEGRTRANARFQSAGMANLTRDWAYQSNAESLDVAVVVSRINPPPVGGWPKVIIQAWAERGTLAPFTVASNAVCYPTLALLQGAINAGTVDASLPPWATACEVTLPNEVYGLPPIAVPAALEFVQLASYGGLLVRTPVGGLGRSCTVIPLNPATRYAAFVDPAGVAAFFGLPVLWRVQ